MSFFRFRLYPAFGALLVSLLAGCGGNPPLEPVKVTLLGINDLNGNLLPPSGSVVVADPANSTGTRVSAGGVAYMSTLVNSLRAQHPAAIFVGAGNLVGASPLYSALFHDEPTIEALNQMGLDFSAVGNNEFYKGTVELKRIQNGGCLPLSSDGSRGVVGVDTCMSGGKFAGAKFQYLGANVTEQSTAKTLLPPYAIRSVGGVDIAFIGITLKSTPALTPPSSVVGLTFAEEVKTVNDLIPELKRKGVSSIVVLIGQGGSTTASTVNDKTCPGLNGEIVKLVDQFDAAVDVVFSGYTRQEYVCTRPDGKLLTQAGFNGRILTKVDLVVDPNTRKVKTKEANNLVVVNDVGVRNAQGALIPLPSGMTALAKDSNMANLIQRYVDQTAPITSKIVGNLQSPLTRTANSAGESQVGDVIADSYLAGTSGGVYGPNAAQIAFMNTGGIRADLNASLQVSFGQLFSVTPFGNYLVTMSLTGDQILRLLEQQWESPQPAGGRVMQVSKGFSYTWDASKPAGAPSGTGARVVPGSMSLNGVAIDPNQTYRVTVNNFMASGGDNYSVLTKGTNPQVGLIDIDASVAYFMAQGTVPTPGQNRITRLN